MTERFFRIILGGSLLLFLFFDAQSLMYAYIGLLFFEGATNLRIPRLATRMRSGADNLVAAGAAASYRINFEAERALRLLVAALLIISYVALHEALWFVPWFIGFALLLAGLTGVCPMYISLRWMGFR